MTKTFTALFAIGLLMSASAFAAEKTITLAVTGMDCTACPVIVKSSLEAVPGVGKAVVSYPDKTAVVTFDDRRQRPRR